MLSNEEFTRYAQLYIDTVYRVALNYIKSRADAEDITQDVFVKLLQTHKQFDDDVHVKSWLIRVTVNACKNLVRSKWWKRKQLEEHAVAPAFQTPEQSELYCAVMELPKKYRVPIYLYYYEDYSTKEIAEILQLPKNTVCTQLKRGRELLKASLTEVDEHV